MMHGQLTAVYYIGYDSTCRAERWHRATKERLAGPNEMGEVRNY